MAIFDSVLHRSIEGGMSVCGSNLGLLLKCFGCQIRTSLPTCLRSLLLSVRTVQLDRTPAPLPTIVDASHPSRGTSASINVNLDAHGMSPKKQHEVERMASYLAALLASTPELGRIQHAVDVGAGQVDCPSLLFPPPCLSLSC
jgi:hypothetical protein